MEALWVLGVVALAAVLHIGLGPWLDRRADRKSEARRLAVAVAFMRLYSGQPPRRGR